MKIIHLGVIHNPKEFKKELFNRLVDKYNDPIKDPYFENVVESQFLAAQFILKNPHLPVVEERANEDLRKEDHSINFGIGRITDELFPNGFPNDFEKLTENQKNHLYRYGGVRILFDLEKIPMIHKGCRKEIAELYISKIVRKKQKKDDEKIDYVNIKREREMIFCAKETAIECYGNLEDATVIIACGYAHDFKLACEEQKIELQFEDTNTSEFCQITSTQDHEDTQNKENPTILSPLLTLGFLNKQDTQNTSLTESSPLLTSANDQERNSEEDKYVIENHRIKQFPPKPGEQVIWASNSSEKEPRCSRCIIG